MHASSKTYEYDKYVQWCALPSHLRNPRTQKELAKQLSVEQSTLSDWRRRPDFEKRVKTLAYKWIGERTPDVLEALLRGALGQGHGSAQDRKNFLIYVAQLDKRDDSQKGAIGSIQAALGRLYEQGLAERRAKRLVDEAGVKS